MKFIIQGKDALLLVYNSPAFLPCWIHASYYLSTQCFSQFMKVKCCFRATNRCMMGSDRIAILFDVWWLCNFLCCRCRRVVGRTGRRRRRNRRRTRLVSSAATKRSVTTSTPFPVNLAKLSSDATLSRWVNWVAAVCLLIFNSFVISFYCWADWVSCAVLPHVHVAKNTKVALSMPFDAQCHFLFVINSAVLRNHSSKKYLFRHEIYTALLQQLCC